MVYWLFGQESDAPIEHVDIEVEYREPPPGPESAETKTNKSSRKKPATRGRARGHSAKGSGLSRFVPSGEGLFQPKGDAYFEKAYAEAKGSGEWPEEAWGAHGADMAQYAEHLGHFDRLREEIEQMLFYPSVLARHGHKGVINARITFTGDSQCAFKRTRVEGANPYLRVYVLALINKVCGLSAISRMGFRENQKADLSFNFFITGQLAHRELDEQTSRIVGNVLTFQRGFTESQLEWKLGPIRGVWFAPVINLDIPWIVENWETYVDKKDPLRDFR